MWCVLVLLQPGGGWVLGIIQLQNYNVCNVIMCAVTPLSGGHCGHCQVRADKLTIVMQLPNNPVTPHHQHPVQKAAAENYYECIVEIEM